MPLSNLYKIILMAFFRLSAFIFFPLILSLTFSSCHPQEGTSVESDTTPLFKKLDPEESGIAALNEQPSIAFNNANQPIYSNYYGGSGVAAGDINGDDLPDLFFTGNNGTNYLYLNKGNLQFEEIGDKAGIAGYGWATGVTMADINGDGLTDIYVCQGGPSSDAGQRENLLFINNGNETFTEQAKAYGLNDGNRSVQAAFFDYDRDGDLDCFVANEAPYWNMPLEQAIQRAGKSENRFESSSHLYRNNGNGTFSVITQEAGLERLAFSRGLYAGDINQDGWCDIYVTNAGDLSDYLFLNNGDGTFTDQIANLTRQGSRGMNGCDVADMSNDAFPDILSVGFSTPDYDRKNLLSQSEEIVDGSGRPLYSRTTLQLNNRNYSFSQVSSLSGLSGVDWGYAALLADFDLDGHKDCFVTNGDWKHMKQGAIATQLEALPQKNEGMLPQEGHQEEPANLPELKLADQVFKNNGNLTFLEMTNSWGLGEATVSRGAAAVDLDRDGDLDLIVCHLGKPHTLYRNNAIEQKRGHYLEISLEGGAAGDPVFLAKAKLYQNGEVQYQEMMNTRGYLSSGESLLHFGLGSNQIIDTLKIFWPNGAVQKYYSLETDQLITIKYDPQGAELFHPNPANALPLVMIRPASAGMSFIHQNNAPKDFEKDPLLPFRLSDAGPFISVGDLNGDGKEDCFFGGAAGQHASLFLAGDKGNYQATDGPWKKQAAADDRDIFIFDANGDTLQDIYIVSGGGGNFQTGEALLQDRLYKNMGDGRFELQGDALPEMRTFGSCVSGMDFDQDGDMDLFIGGAANPHRYPLADRSYLLLNESGYFTDVTASWAPELLEVGPITAAQWTDLNGDDWPDLVLAGHWTPIRIFLSDGSQLRDASAEWGTADLTGFWNSLALLDVNQDGRLDIVAGNLGLNTPFQPTKDRPLRLYGGDLDKNGTHDVILSTTYKGDWVMVGGLSAFQSQFPEIAATFPSSAGPNTTDLETLFGATIYENSLIKEVVECRSMVFLNRENKSFEPIPLPVEAQVSAVTTILVQDFNADGQSDLLLGGNNYGINPLFYRQDAGNGLILLGESTGGFIPLSTRESNLYIPGSVTDIARLQTAYPGIFFFLVANNQGENQIFVWNTQG